MPRVDVTVFFKISLIASLTICLNPTKPQADPTYLVSKSGFDCLVKHRKKYFDQGKDGGQIYVDFADCPLDMTLRERMKARSAKAFLIGPDVREDEEVAESSEPVYTDLVIFSRRQLACLVANRTSVELETRNGAYVAILPAECDGE